MRNWIHWTVVGLFGPAVLGGVELGLRIAAWFDPEALVVTLAQQDGQALRSINAEFAQRFFFERYQGELIASGRMEARPFYEPAPVRPLRIVFAGASTVQGFPHARRLASPAILEAMLGDALPGRPVEVYNLGITSIASFAVARTVDEAMSLSPDAVVVYTGQNEFYGIYGVGDRPTPLANQVHYALMQWRIPRMMRSALDRVRGRGVSATDLMDIMAQRGAVPPGDRRRQHAREHLRQNLRHVTETCRRHAVPVIFCTLVANEAGFAPAGSSPVPEGSAYRDRWESAVAAGTPLMMGPRATREQATRALESLDAAQSLSADHAWLCYLRGRALAALNRTSESRGAFQRARELDTMPWRAPVGHNEVIRAEASRSGARLADVEAAFVAASPPEGIGWELMSDHVHPSVPGQVLLARTVLKALATSSAGSDLALDRVGDDGTYLERLGYLPVERVRVAQAMSELLAATPMDRYNQHNAEHFGQLAAALWSQLSPQEQAGARKWMQHRSEVPLVLDVADELFRAHRFDAAAAHYRASSLEAPLTPRGDLWAAVQLGWCRHLSGLPLHGRDRQDLEAARYGAAFLAQAPGLPAAYITFVRGTLSYFLEQHEEALDLLERTFQDTGFRTTFLHSFFPALAAELVRAGRLEDARRYGRIASQEAGGDPHFVQMVESLAPANHQISQ